MGGKRKGEKKPYKSYEWWSSLPEKKDGTEERVGKKSERARGGGGGRGKELGGDWPSYTAQYDTHFSSLHTYSRDQGTGIF